MEHSRAIRLAATPGERKRYSPAKTLRLQTRGLDAEPGQLRVVKARRPPRLTPLGRPPPLAASGACAALPGRAHFQAL